MTQLHRNLSSCSCCRLCSFPLFCSYPSQTFTPLPCAYQLSLQLSTRGLETATTPFPSSALGDLVECSRRHCLADPNPTTFPTINSASFSVRTRSTRELPADISKSHSPCCASSPFVASPTPRLPRQQCRPLPRLRLTPVPATLVRATRLRRAARVSRRARRTATRRSTRLTSGALPTA